MHRPETTTMFQHLEMLDTLDHPPRSHAFERARSDTPSTDVRCRLRSTAISGVQRELTKCENQTHSKCVKRSHYRG